MALPLPLLTTKADCGKVLEELTDLKSDLEFKKITLTHSRENAYDRASIVNFLS
ncbi:hypothetical protein [Xanthocytophaga agilis]|uniref:Uncharacterized protein n=1 Tax=Xanthocytophaga agilis TaxID=3048010 RepID=A0AAE3R9L7_9BACT|nr:hypothetical protein [Xanthocytophaga agilis]MDJ1503302.1 hypothetical protein [Xanthocytophaga agilis]